MLTDREFAEELRVQADRICNAIFHMDLAWIDIQIQVSQLRDFVEEHAPEKLELFEMVYESRFRRLFETWRHRPCEAESWTWGVAAE